MKVYKGNILTCDPQNHVCRFLVEDRGRIVYVGNELPAIYNKAAQVELGEKALVPAFGDSHIHFASYATFRAGLNVSCAKSNAEILEMLRQFVPTCKDKLVIAFGASNHSVCEKKLLTRKELDSVCPDKPLFMAKYDGHTCIVNITKTAVIFIPVQDGSYSGFVFSEKWCQTAFLQFGYRFEENMWGVQRGEIPWLWVSNRGE